MINIKHHYRSARPLGRPRFADSDLYDPRLIGSSDLNGPRLNTPLVGVGTPPRSASLGLGFILTTISYSTDSFYTTVKIFLGPERASGFAKMGSSSKIRSSLRITHYTTRSRVSGTQLCFRSSINELKLALDFVCLNINQKKRFTRKIQQLKGGDNNDG